MQSLEKTSTYVTRKQGWKMQLLRLHGPRQQALQHEPKDTSEFGEILIYFPIFSITSKV